MICYFQLLKLSSCHSNKCSECLHSLPRQNIYDSIKDTHSGPHVNDDRCSCCLLRKGVSVFLVSLNTQFLFIPLFSGREWGAEMGRMMGLQLVRFRELFGLVFEGTTPAKLRIALSSFSPRFSLPPSLLILLCHSTAMTTFNDFLPFFWQVTAAQVVIVLSTEPQKSA